MDWCCAFDIFVDWVGALAGPHPALDSLFITFHGGPNFSGLPMGRAAIGNGLPGNFSRAAGIGSALSADEGFFIDHSLADVVVIISPHVLLRNGKIEQR